MISSFPDFHRPTDGTFPGIVIRQRGIDQIFSSEKHTGTLRTSEPFSTTETIKIDAHFAYRERLSKRWDSGCVVQEQWDPCAMRNFECARQAVISPGGIHHRRLFIHRRRQLFRCLRHHQFPSRQPNCAIESDSAAQHDHFMFHAGCVRQAAKFYRIRTRLYKPPLPPPLRPLSLK